MLTILLFTPSWRYVSYVGLMVNFSNIGRFFLQTCPTERKLTASFNLTQNFETFCGRVLVLLKQ